jgi:glycosyltransferase involved in cell wall biosynthesis
MAPINVLHINAEMGWGGGETQTYYLIQGLKDHGYQQSVACQPRSALANRCHKDGIPVHLVKMPTQFSLRALIQLRRVIQEEKIRIIHFHTSRAHTLGVMASLGLGNVIRVVTRRIAHRPGSWWRTRLLYNRGSDAVVAISEAVKGVLISAGVATTKLGVIPSGVDLKKFASGNGLLWRTQLDLPSDSLVIGYVGKLSRGKDIDTLLRAAQAVVVQYPTSRALIVGEGPYRAQLERLAVELEISSQVIFPGFLEDIPGILAAIDILVLPSFKEAASNVIREAMAAGKPVIASRVGGVPECVVDGETGFLVAPGDNEAISRSILRLLENPSLRDQFGKAGRHRVETHFSIGQMICQYENLYQDLLEQTPFRSLHTYD